MEQKKQFKEMRKKLRKSVQETHKITTDEAKGRILKLDKEIAFKASKLTYGKSKNSKLLKKY